MPLAVGIVRDKRYLEHKPGLVHPESPNRLRSIYRMLDNTFPEGLIDIEPRLATLEELELVHTPAYINQILGTAERDFTPLAPDTSASSSSYLAAWLAVGGCIRGVDAVMSGECRAVFCLVRPPGHHALADRAGGFCIFNNLGIAAKYALKQYRLNRILIVDWDVHHGNALQELFYTDNHVLYFSTHYMGWFPHTGDWNETGEGLGSGYTINIPVFKELEDHDIIHIYRDLLGDVVRKFRPQLILVAAGFDAHHRDPLGRTRLTETSYKWLAQIVLQLSDGARAAPVLFSLEGGYDNYALSVSVREVLKVLTFQGRRDRIPLVATKKAAEIVKKTRKVHETFGIWTR